jgi:hypothetical protein
MKPLFERCEQIANAGPGNTNQITSLFLQMSLTYYSDVRKQALQSFWSALAAAGVGMLFFLYATQAMTHVGKVDSSTIGIVAGGLAQFISAVNFYLYFKAARQFASFHICLERTDRFLIANTICEQLQPPLRDEARQALVKLVATAPMLTLEAATGKTREPAAAREQP